MKKLINKGDLPSFILFGVTLFLLSFLLIDINGIEIYLRILTPLLALGTGIAIVLTLRENQKSNKFLASKEVYEEYRRQINIHLKDTNIAVEGINIYEQGSLGETRIIKYYEPLQKIDVFNWHDKLMEMLELVQVDKGFKKWIMAFEKDEIYDRNFTDFPYVDLAPYVDQILEKVNRYYRVLQDQYKHLLTHARENLAPTHIRILASIIENESDYNYFASEISRYFHAIDDTYLKLTKTAEQYNYPFLMLDYEQKDDGKLEYKVTRRYLIDWEIFSLLFKTHQEILSILDSR